MSIPARCRESNTLSSSPREASIGANTMRTKHFLCTVAFFRRASHFFQADFKGGRPPYPCLCQVAVLGSNLRPVDAHVNPVFLKNFFPKKFRTACSRSAQFSLKRARGS